MKRKLGLTACYLSRPRFPRPCAGCFCSACGRTGRCITARPASWATRPPRWRRCCSAAAAWCCTPRFPGAAGGRPWPQILACAALRRAGAEREAALARPGFPRRCPCGILNSTPCACGCSFPAISSRTRCGRHGGGAGRAERRARRGIPPPPRAYFFYLDAAGTGKVESAPLNLGKFNISNECHKNDRIC